MVWRRMAPLGLGMVCLSVIAGCASSGGQQGEAHPERARQDSVHVRTWNRFMDEALQLHHRLTDGQAMTVSRTLGGYANQPEFYRQDEYRNAAGQLVSRLQWEREHPERLHAIEVFLLDARGRVIRDYAGAYLPYYRNAPTQTLISLHAYNGELHAFRTFDASGDLLFERCEGRHRGKPVSIQLEFDDIYRMQGEPNTTLTSAAYLACFRGIDNTAGRYLRPQ